jgi:hypothetical protein
MDASTAATGPHFGRIDEAFVTADVLTDDQIRNLYCAKISHTNGATPARFTLNVRRRRRGAALASSDFSTAPLRLYNFSAGSLGDEGSNGQVLVNNGAAISVAGVDGISGNAFNFAGAQNLSATDAGLPSGLAARSHGCWIKTLNSSGSIVAFAWGTMPSGKDELYVGSGLAYSNSGSDNIGGTPVGDGQWHFCVSVVDNVALDGLKHKFYVDGRLSASSTGIGTITLAGAGAFRIGCEPPSTYPFFGQIDGVFICNYALTQEQIAMLYAKSSQTLTPSPKNPGDHIEGADANNLLAIFDTLDTNAQVDLKVAS